MSDEIVLATHVQAYVGMGKPSFAKVINDEIISKSERGLSCVDVKIIGPLQALLLFARNDG